MCDRFSVLTPFEEGGETMILRRNKRRMEDDRLDRLQREILLATGASEDEIDDVADSPDLYENVRLRIAADERAWLEPRPRSAFFTAPLRWSFAAAVVLILLAVAALLWLPRSPRETREIALLVPQAAPTSPAPPPAGFDQAMVSPKTSIPPQKPLRASRRRPRTQDHTEVATEFIPLTYIAGPASTDSGHVVRINVSRSALIAMGVPMNVERAGESVKADVFIGDDGLARAIRFVQ
jgi:hypothetical protein